MFLDDKKEEICRAYQSIVQEFPFVFQRVERAAEKCSPSEALALRYFYTAMPLSDMVNYEGEIFLDFARQGVYLWENMEGVSKLPQDIFLNYVLHYRVNEEEIRPCRQEFWSEIKDRIKGKTTLEAALEINYWCAQEVTYQSGDDRTLSARAVYERGYGRCGEESVFYVNALRSAGIPARQVYVPRWSHCDDNHAWVEFWCQGKWYFAGACEPFMVPDKGWFTNAASRAMLVHSRVFGENRQPEEDGGKEGMVQSFDQLERYAKTRKITVWVKDQQGDPVKDARVKFQILNMAEYHTCAEFPSDKDGKVSFVTGLGSIFLYVNYKDLHGEETADVDKKDSFTVVLGKRDRETDWKEVDMIAPKDACIHPDISTREQVEEGKKKAARADMIRKEKKDGWENREIRNFLAADQQTAFLRKAMVDNLSQKDLTDAKQDVLEEHLAWGIAYKDKMAPELYVPYILNPRIENEILGTYREEISKAFTSQEISGYRQDPKALWAAIDSRIQEFPDRERKSVDTMPGACIKYGVGSRRSKEILFVAAARTFGICARYNTSYHTIEYWKEDKFVPVFSEEERTAVLILENREGIHWKYFQNWSLGRQKDGEYESLDLRGATFKETLKLDLPEGRYRLVTADRLPNGNVFALQKEFYLAKGQERREELRLRKADLEDMLESLELPEFFLKDRQGQTISSCKLTQGGKHVFLWLEVGHEPTEHILNEMLEQEEAFREYEDRICFIVPDKEALENPTLMETRTRFPGIALYYDSFKENVEQLGRRVYVDHEKLPLVIVTKGKDEAIYGASGYHVGMGNMLLRLMGKEV